MNRLRVPLIAARAGLLQKWGMKTGFGIETTINSLLRDDGRARFANPKPIHERVCEWLLGALWFVAAAVFTTAVVWA